MRVDLKNFRAKNLGTGHIRRLTGVSLVALSMAAAATAHADVEVLGIRTGQHPDKTRVVLDVSERVDFSIRYITTQDPRTYEIHIDLDKAPGEDIARVLTRKAEAVGILEKVSLEKKNGTLRLKLTLRKAATIDRYFTLNPEEGVPIRIVFDLKPVSIAEWHRLVLLSQLPEPEPVPAIPTAPEVVEDAPPMAIVEEDSYEDDVATRDYNGFSFSGYMEAEGRAFLQSAFAPVQPNWAGSVSLEPRLEYVSESGNSQLIVDIFGRLDAEDDDRTHWDVREFKWIGLFDAFQITAGIDQVFWGVTESSHLVNILNQDDALEDVDGEDKLGQPMVTLSYNTEFGLFSAYFMTYFRERRFAGVEGRLRPGLPVDYSQTEYEAASDKWHMDWAVRWSHVIGDFDVGLSHFQGTARAPTFVMGQDGAGNPVLIPRYNLINQTGIDLQATLSGWLLKVEGIYQTGPDENYWATAAGFEYTFYGLFGGDSDIGFLGEYLYDDRGERATTSFENDIFAGFRWTPNDVDSTEFLVGGIFDLNSSAKFLNIEGSRRIGDYWKISLDVRLFLGVPVQDPLYLLSQDDFIQLRLARYF